MSTTTGGQIRRTTVLPTPDGPDWDEQCAAWQEWLTLHGVPADRVRVGAKITVDDTTGTITVPVLALRHGRPYRDLETDDVAVEDLTVQHHGTVLPFPQKASGA